MRHRRACSIVAAALVAGCGRTSDAERAPETGPPDPVAGATPSGTATPSPGTVGRLIALDPPSGTPPVPLPSGPVTSAAPPPPLARPDLVPTVSPDGTVSLTLDDSYLAPLVATVSCDGRIGARHGDPETSTAPDCAPDDAEADR